MLKKMIFAGMVTLMSAQVANAQWWNVTDGNKFDAMSSSNNRTVYVGIGAIPNTNYRLNVGGASYFSGATKIGSTLTVSGTSTFNNALKVSGASTLNSTLKVGGAATLMSSLNVYGATTLNSTLIVKGKITCQNEIEVTAMNAGSINAKDINVELPAAADYVFEDSYNLKSLSEVEDYVKENKHLPGMPSASEFAEKGMSVSQMSNLLLEKIEELTLHMIELEKENKALKAEMDQMRK